MPEHLHTTIGPGVALRQRRKREITSLLGLPQNATAARIKREVFAKFADAPFIGSGAANRADKREVDRLLRETRDALDLVNASLKRGNEVLGICGRDGTEQPGAPKGRGDDSGKWLDEDVRRAREEWQRNRGLQEEFPDVDDYVAFKEAERKGLAGKPRGRS